MLTDEGTGSRERKQFAHVIDLVRGRHGIMFIACIAQLPMALRMWQKETICPSPPWSHLPFFCPSASVLTFYPHLPHQLSGIVVASYYCCGCSSSSSSNPDCLVHLPEDPLPEDICLKGPLNSTKAGSSSLVLSPHPPQIIPFQQVSLHV